MSAVERTVFRAQVKTAWERLTYQQKARVFVGLELLKEGSSYGVSTELPEIASYPETSALLKWNVVYERIHQAGRTLDHLLGAIIEQQAAALDEEALDAEYFRRELDRLIRLMNTHQVAFDADWEAKAKGLIADAKRNES